MKIKLVLFWLSAGLLLGCGGSSDSPITTPEPPVNSPPIVTANFPQITEKTSVNLAVSATDNDGSITNYSWVQVAGPTLSLTGIETANVSFTVPSIGVNTEISFNITVTDDDGATTQITQATTINRVESTYVLSGAVAGSSFVNAKIGASVANDNVHVDVDAMGNFSANLKVDDDVPLNKLVKLSVSNDAGLTMVKLLSSLEQLNTTAASSNAAVSAFKTGSKISASRALVNPVAVINQNTISVSAASTALYSLLISANGGSEPGNIDDFELVESQINPDALIEAVAVTKLILENDNISLPFGVSNLVELLSTTSAYNTFISAIEQANPGLIASTVTAVLDDPVLTPPLSASDVPSFYYQTRPVAPTFVARGGSRYQFDSDQTGSLTSNEGVSNFQWELVGGDIHISYLSASGAISYSVLESIPGLSLEQKQQLIAAQVSTVEVTYLRASEVLQRLSTGSRLDTYRIDVTSERSMTPIVLDSGTISVDPWEDTEQSDVLMRRSASNGLVFEASQLTGLWGLDIYNETSYNNIHFEVLSFNSDGTGQSQDTGAQFNWTVTQGALSLNFSTFTQSFIIIDAVSTDYSLYSEIKNLDNNVLATAFGLGLPVQDDTTFSTASLVTGPQDYWQTMVNQWTASAWDGDRLKLCTFDDCGTYGYTFFGFYNLESGIGTRVSSFEGLPPEMINFGGFSTDWLVQDDGTVKYDYLNSCSDNSAEACRYREWRLLKSSDGRLGERLYVQEYEMRRNTSTSGWYYFITPRANIYEKIELEYFNNTSLSQLSSVASQKNTNHTVGRLVIEPNQLELSAE